MPEALFHEREDHFEASELTRGPWDPEHQHAGPPSALIARRLERTEPREGMRVSRVALEILRPIPIAPLRVDSRVVRPGRSVEMLEAELSGPDGATLILARAWRIRTEQLGLPQPEAVAPPGPEEGRLPTTYPTDAKLGYHRAMEFRFVAGDWAEPGPATAWARLRVPVVAGEEPSPLVRLLAAADSGNGVSSALDWREWVFINTDLVVTVLRHPAGEWVCLDSVTYPEPDGIGLSDTTLWDERGRLGRATQSLFVARRRSG